MEKQTIDANQRIKANIQRLVEVNQLQSARQLLAQYIEMASGDTDIFSMQAVIEMQEGNLDKAIIVLQKGLKVIPGNFDLLYNLACAYEMQEDYCRTYGLLQQLKQVPQDDDMKNLVVALQKRIESKYPTEPESKAKIAFFVKPQMDSFLGDIIDSLKSDYNVKKCIVTDAKQIDEGMVWADVCWFEWCDELVAYGSNHKMASQKKIVCRLHRYEAFTNYPQTVKWENVDQVIFVAEHIREVFLKKIKFDRQRCHVIHNGVDCIRFPYFERKKGYNIAWIGYLNLRKNPGMLIQHFNELVKEDNRFKLHFAGEFQEEILYYYLNDIVDRLNLKKNIKFYGHIPNSQLADWMRDKHYIVSSSIAEGHPVGIMEAMAAGLKPAIHYFPGAEKFYDKQYLYYDVSGFKKIFLENDYEPKQYSQFIQKRYSLETQILSIRKLLIKKEIKKEIGKMIHDEKAGVNIEKKKKPLVTIGIVNYNNARYLPICIQSFLKQTYSNLEIIIVDDNSFDGSKKLIEAYQKKHANIKSIVHKKNTGGFTTGLQEIVLHAQGEYIQFISSDDFVSINAIEKFVDYLECNIETDYCFSDVNIVNENNEFVIQSNYVCYSPQEVVYKFFETEKGVIPSHGLFRKNFFTMNNINWIIYRGNDYSSDTLNIVYFIKNNMKYDKLEEPLVQYRQHDKNISYDIEKRISGTAAILDFIINNFDASVYLPEIPWARHEDCKQFESYVYAMIYFKKIENTIDFSNIPEFLKRGRTVDRKKMIFFARELIQDCEKYIDMGLILNGPYELELTNLQDKIVKIKSEMQK